MKKIFLAVLVFLAVCSGCSGGSGSYSVPEDSQPVAGLPDENLEGSSEFEAVPEVPAKSLAELGWKEVADFDIGFCLPPADGIKQQERYVANGDGPMFQVSYYFETGNYMEDFSADGVPQKVLARITRTTCTTAVSKDNIGIGGPGFLSVYKSPSMEEVNRTEYELYSEEGGLCIYRATGGTGTDNKREFLLFREGDTAYYTIATSNSAFDAGYFTEETYGMFIGSLKYLGWDKDVEALPGWEVAYKAHSREIDEYASNYHMDDINKDGLPELLCTSQFNGFSTELWYFDREGILRYGLACSIGYTDDTLVYGTLSHGRSTGRGVMAYNRDTGIYEGTTSIEENHMNGQRYLVDNNEVTKEQYESAMEVINSMEVRSTDDMKCKGTSLNDVIEKYKLLSNAAGENSWKAKYIAQLDESVAKWGMSARVNIGDINGDGVPEIWYSGSSQEQRLIYLDCEGTLRYIDYPLRTFYSMGDVLYIDGGRQGRLFDTVYVRNKSTGVYLPEFGGCYYDGDDNSYKIQDTPIGGIDIDSYTVHVSKEQYEEKLNIALGDDSDSEIVFSDSVVEDFTKKDGVRSVDELSQMIVEY